MRPVKEASLWICLDRYIAWFPTQPGIHTFGTNMCVCVCVDYKCCGTVVEELYLFLSVTAVFCTFPNQRPRDKAPVSWTPGPGGCEHEGDDDPSSRSSPGLWGDGLIFSAQHTEGGTESVSVSVCVRACVFV